MAHSAEQIRWGILATGGIANRFVEDLRLLPEAHVLAVGSRSAESAAAFAQRHGIPRTYGSWAELAADDEIDVVYVATPHSAHHAAAAVCLKAGRAVLCEKPFTLDAATAADLVGLARAVGVFLMEAMWTWVNPAVRRIVELVGEGAIGEISHVTADFGLPGPVPPGRLTKRELGGGALLDLGVYPVAFSQLLLGPPDSVQAWARMTAEGVDENTGIVLGHPNGAVATLQCGFVGDTARQAVITGTRGRIEVPRHFFRPDGFTLVRDDEGEWFDYPIRGNGMGYEAEEVMRCLRAGELESPLVPLSATLIVMSTLDTIRERIGLSYA
jgi:predicted dehydrogenase